MSIKMKSATCPTCGGFVLKLAGPASKLCFDECPKCRGKRQERENATGSFVSAVSTREE